MDRPTRHVLVKGVVFGESPIQTLGMQWLFEVDGAREVVKGVWINCDMEDGVQERLVAMLPTLMYEWLWAAPNEYVIHM
mgnify:CR=1 FL=1